MVYRNAEIDTQFFTPRSYQQELLDKAKERNIIIPLGTGSGKTFIAIMLIKEMAAELRIPLEEGGKRAFFLVNKVALCVQQAECIKEQTNLSVSAYHGMKDPDKWGQGRWTEEIKNSQVMVMTAQIFWDLLNHGFFCLDKANLLIFDECHHACSSSSNNSTGHPYRKIMQRYKELPREKAPKVLGLTASVISANVDPVKLSKKMEELEMALCARIVTTSDIVTAAQYGAKPRIKIVLCADFELNHSSICEAAHRMLKGADDFTAASVFDPDFDINPTKPVMEAFRRSIAILQQLGPWCAWKVCQIWENKFRKLNKYSMTEQSQLFILMGETYIRAAKHILEPVASKADSLEKIQKLLPNKVVKLLNILKLFKPSATAKENNNDFSCIVFVQQRYVAYILKVLLKSIQKMDKENFGFLKLDFVIGYSGYNVSAEEDMALHRRQEEVLRKFRQKNLNLIISTSVLEEGIDVRQCNCVIRFDPPGDYRSYIQSKGRARKASSVYYVLIEEKEKLQFMKQMQNFALIEDILLNRAQNRDNPPPEEFDIDLADSLVEAYEPPLKAKPDGTFPEARPRVTMSTAISLVNRYCAKLPSDMFTKLVPRCEMEEIEEKGVRRVRAHLTLPINSPVRDRITSPWMPNKKFAQMASALETCKVLHEAKELDEHLLPVGKESAVRMLNEMEDDGEIWPADGRQRPGSTKRKQYYDRQTAYALSDALPMPNTPCFVHVIQLNLAVAANSIINPKNRKILDPADCPRHFGIVSTKILPKIPSFPIYTRQGEVSVSYNTLPVTLCLNPKQIHLLSQFHGFIFSEILCLEKFSMEYNPEFAENNYFVAPLLQDGEHMILDWNFVEHIVQKSTEEALRPSDEERESFVFDSTKFEDAIVTPWYRNMDQPHYYYVAEVRDDMTPSTGFPDNEYSTFSEYFEKKYKITIYNQSQPLLDVDYTSSRLNLLIPRFVNKRGLPLRMNKGTTLASIQKQILVPELVSIHPIPASMWNIIVVLPSVLYRTNYLLLADELRAQVEVEGFGKPDAGWVDPNYIWEPLSYGWDKNMEAHMARLRGGRTDGLVSYTVAEGEERSSKGANSEQATVDESRDDDEESFDIGVWDPSVMHDALEWNLGRPTQAVMDIAGQGDMVGLSMGTSQMDFHMEEEEEDDGDIIFDVEFSRHAMSLEGKRKTEDDDAAEEVPGPPSLFQPNRNIEPTGWESSDVPSFGIAGGVIQLVSVDKVFDINSLAKDIVADVGVRKPKPILESRVNGGKSSEAERISPEAYSKDPAYRHNNRVYKSFSDILDDDIDRRAEEECLDVSDSDGPSCSTASNNGSSAKQMRFVEVLEDDDQDKLSDSKPIYPTHEEVERLEPVEEELAVRQDPHLIGRTFKLVDESVVPAPDSNVLQELGFSFEPKQLSMEAAPIHAPYGPNPALILQALTMSNASDGINLERLETVGDSFLKYAVTDFLFNSDEGRRMHEGKLSFARSKLVSNYNLYRLGKRKEIGKLMVAGKFEPRDNWLPPGYTTLDQKTPNQETTEEEDLRVERLLEGEEIVEEKKPVAKEQNGWEAALGISSSGDVETVDLRLTSVGPNVSEDHNVLPYNILTQQSISDKSVADAVEALIGVFLLTHGPDGARKFMEWLGIKVRDTNKALPIPLRCSEAHMEQATKEVGEIWNKQDFGQVEKIIGYSFRQKAYLIQAFTHASYFPNRVTECYQRLEFLGDAVLDYMITRHLFEDKRRHSPGVLTDLRSALVNNTIFASLAVKYQFHKYFLAICPPLEAVIQKFVKLYKEKAKEANFDEELFLFTDEDSCEDEEDIEVPKALGDIFESLAGAIYLDSDCNLDVVWSVYYKLMKAQLEKCCTNPPKSPIRELLEMEPENAKFSKLERIMTEGKVRVTVDVYMKGRFTGMGRNYRIAKSTAAKRALRYLKALKAQQVKQEAAKNV